MDATLPKRVEQHLAVMQGVVDRLVELHASAGRQTQDALEADGDWTAIWEMGGRCLALANAYIDQCRRGFVVEAQITARALHVASLLAFVMCDENERSIRTDWLAGRELNPRDVRAALKRVQDSARQAMDAAGIEPAGDAVDLVKEFYKLLSGAPHNARLSFEESIGVEPRVFSYGPHPDWGMRATVEMVGHLRAAAL
jgi:hypothetical protein